MPLLPAPPEGSEPLPMKTHRLGLYISIFLVQDNIIGQY